MYCFIIRFIYKLYHKVQYIYGLVMCKNFINLLFFFVPMHKFEENPKDN
jgi:hypothetical protein